MSELKLVTENVSRGCSSAQLVGVVGEERIFKALFKHEFL